MRPGPSPSPRRRLSPQLRDAVLSSDRPAWVIATLAGWPQYPAFSRLLHARRVRATATTTARLRRVAHLVGFPGDIYAADDSEATS
jgi:hypothetical protein